ncbi:MAG: GAF domain-containing protein [Bdellovibrionales bacterium]
MAKSDIYKIMEQELHSLLTEELPLSARLATFVATIYQKLPGVSWVGFYLSEGTSRDLWVSHYQGPVACLYIPKGKGVCGTAFEQKRTLVVPDVHQFPGHIACDSKSQSEIVLPLPAFAPVKGVLDLDSHSLSNFDDEDAKKLESLLELLFKVSHPTC